MRKKTLKIPSETSEAAEAAALFTLCDEDLDGVLQADEY